MKAALVIVVLFCTVPPKAEAQTKGPNRSPVTQKTVKKTVPKFVKNARLSVSSLNLVCPKNVWFGPQKKLPGTTSRIYQARFQSIRHTKKKKYAVGAYQCTYRVSGAKKPISFYTTKRKYPKGGEWDGVKCTIDGRRLSCVEKSTMDVPNEKMAVPSLPSTPK